MTASFDFSALSQISALRIVDCLLEGTLVATFAGLMLRVIRRQSSAARFAVWFSALMAIAALPLFGGEWWPRGAGALAAISPRPQIIVPSSWALYLFAAWAAMAMFGLARVGVGLLHLRRLRRTCVSIDPASLDPELQETLARYRANRSVDLCISGQVQVPTAIGLMSPTVVIPSWLMQELSPAELNQVVLHELAHLRRLDDWTNLAQKIVKALFFFHPAVWWIEKRVSLEREMACDDAVVAEIASPRQYAECLAHLAEKSMLRQNMVRRSMLLAQAALGRIRQTSLRVAQILNRDRHVAARSWKPAVSLLAGFAIACAACVSRAPKLVGFEDTPSAIVAGAVLPSLPAAPGIHQVIAAPSNSAKARAVNFKPASLQPRVVLAKAVPPHTVSKGGDYVTADLYDEPIAEPDLAGLVHMAEARPNSASVTQAVFVIVQGQPSDSTDHPAYRISVWRITVLQPSDNSSTNRIPRKET